MKRCVLICLVSVSALAVASVIPTSSSAAGSIQATEGAAFSGQVGTGNACALSATINWGDGTTSSGTLGSGGSISGSHTYSEEGSYNSSFRWTCDTPGSGSGSFTATVADAALSAAGSPVSATAGEGFNATVATFTDADPAGTTSDYAARIDWGDGSSSMGTVASSGSSFTVGGSHEYTAVGSFRTAVTVTDGGGASAVGRGTATVAAAPSGVRAVFSVSPGGPLEVSQPLVLDGSASTGHGLRYRWDLDGSGKFATDSGATPSVQTTFATAGAHLVSLRVIDSHGARSTSSETLRIGAGPDYTIKINPGNPRPGQEVHFSVRLLRLATAGGRAVASTAALPAGTVASIGFGDAPGRTYPYLGRYLTRGVQLSTSGEFSHRYQTGGRHVVDVRVVDRAGGSAGITVSFGAGTAAGDHAAGAHAAACCGGAIQAVGIAYSGGLAGRPTAFTADVYPSTVPTGGGAACDVAAGAAGCRHASAAATRSIVLNFPEGVVLGHPLICGLLPPSRDASARGGARARVADNNPPPPGTLFQHDEFVWNLGDTAGSDFCNPNTVDTNQDPNRVDTDTVLHTYHREGIYTISVLVKRRDHALGDKLISSFPASLTVPMITPVCHPIGIFKRSAFTGYLVESGDGCFTPATELGFAPDGGWEAYTTASAVPVTVLGLTLSGSNGPYGGVVVDPHTGFIGDRAPLLYPKGGGAICGQLQTGAVGVQALRCNRDPQIMLTRGTTVLDGFEGAPAVLGLPRSAPPHVTLNGAGPYDPHNPPNTSVFHVRLPAPLGTSIDVDNLAAGEADSDFTLDGNTGALLPTGTPSQSGLGHAANFTVGPLPPIPFGPLTLSSFTITHEDNPAPGAPAWHGGGDVTFLPGGPQLNAEDNVAMQTGVGIGAGGGLLYAGAKADPLPVPIPIPPFFLLTGLGASFGPSPFHIQATGHATDDTGSLLDITGCLAFVVGQRTGGAFPFATGAAWSTTSRTSGSGCPDTSRSRTSYRSTRSWRSTRILSRSTSAGTSTRTSAPSR